MASLFKKHVTDDEVLTALKQIQDPDLHRDIVSLGFVKNLKIEGSSVSFDINLTTPACPVKDQMRAEATEIIRRLKGVLNVNVTMTAEVKPHDGLDKSGLIGIRNIVAIGSGKGGVGKSTVSANLAVALAQSGARVGLLDADIYGPSIPTMMGVKEDLRMTPDQRIVPHSAYGVRFMSMGYFSPADKPMIWRGPMAHKAVQQELFRVDWGLLDYLLVDLPPGTGDVHLTLAQTVPLTGAVIVSTPQDVGLMISMKTLRMFQATNVHILGLIENMSYYTCEDCGARKEIFGYGGVRNASQTLGLPFLGEIPLDPNIRFRADHGMPIAAAEPGSSSGKTYRTLAENLAAQISIRNFSDQIQTIQPPREIIKVGETDLMITWSDGHVSTYPVRYLREECPCAACVDESTRMKRLQPGSISSTLQLRSFDLLGRYALKLTWSDGHNAGIYSFQILRKLCPCAKCKPESISSVFKKASAQ